MQFVVETLHLYDLQALTHLINSSANNRWQD